MLYFLADNNRSAQPPPFFHSHTLTNYKAQSEIHVQYKAESIKSINNTQLIEILKR